MSLSPKLKGPSDLTDGGKRSNRSKSRRRKQPLKVRKVRKKQKLEIVRNS